MKAIIIKSLFSGIFFICFVILYDHFIGIDWSRNIAIKDLSKESILILTTRSRHPEELNLKISGVSSEDIKYELLDMNNKVILGYSFNTTKGSINKKYSCEFYGGTVKLKITPIHSAHGQLFIDYKAF
jgi:hypothetical protein